MSIDNYLDIEKWLHKMYIDSYDIHDDLTVDVNGDVFLKGNIKYIPIQFGTVKGKFDCSGLGLITLKGCPKILNSSFLCKNNKLTSLKYAPQKVKGYFNCSQNQLKTLKGVPEVIEGSFDCSYNNLNSLLFLPKIIEHNLYIQHNKISEKELFNFNSIVAGEIYTDLKLLTSDFLLRINKIKEALLEKETLLNNVSATDNTLKKKNRI